MGGTSIWFTSIAFGIILSVSKSVEENGLDESAGPENKVKPARYNVIST